MLTQYVTCERIKYRAAVSRATSDAGYSLPVRQLTVMSQDVLERVSFLSQAAEFVSQYGGRQEAAVGAYYQYTGREIRLKNQVSCFGWDGQKRNCCRTCFMTLTYPQTASLKTRKGFSVLKCLMCGSSRKRFPVRAEHKTYHEKLLSTCYHMPGKGVKDGGDNSHQSRAEDGKS